MKALELLQRLKSQAPGLALDWSAIRDEVHEAKRPSGKLQPGEWRPMTS